MLSVTASSSRFKRLQAQALESRQCVFMPYILLGWPSQQEALALVDMYVAAGADALELGLAFSEPIADGPVLQAAITEVLQSGYALEQAFELMDMIRQKYPDLPLSLMSYYNPIQHMGEARFVERLKQVGIDALLVVDLPPQLAEQALYPVCQHHGIDLVFIVSPLTTPQRLKTLTRLGSGYLYVVSRLGITGAESRYDAGITTLIQKIHQAQALDVSSVKDRLPLYVGFGISSPENARTMLHAGAQGVITASKIFQLIQVHRRLGTSYQEELGAFLASMVEACHQPLKDA
ncbi:MAG: tryptophan synthase subunit alpha [Vampirovibrionales bacterium]